MMEKLLSDVQMAQTCGILSRTLSGQRVKTDLSCGQYLRVVPDLSYLDRNMNKVPNNHYVVEIIGSTQAQARINLHTNGQRLNDQVPIHDPPGGMDGTNFVIREAEAYTFGIFL